MQTDDAFPSSEENLLLDEDFLAALGLDQVVPESLAPWRPLVAAGLSFFLERLPAERLEAIVAGQLALGEEAGAFRRLVSLLSQCPTLHKLGQVLARHRSLDPELRRHLQSLESMPATLDLEPVLARVREEMGDAPGIELADAALAEGSVAVVLPFTYREGEALRHGVFKVLKPGVEDRLAEELSVLDEVAAFLEERGRALGLPPVDYRESLKSVRNLLSREIRLDVEQANLRAAADLYADEPRVLVPRALPWSTPRLTAMERVFGAKASDAELSEEARRDLADTMVSALLAKPFWSRSADALFHGDLHGGNLFVTDDGRLAILDWSLAAGLAKADREALLAIALGGLTLDARRICRGVASLSTLDEDDPILAEVAERALDRLVRQGGLPGFSWLLGLLDDLAGRTAAGFREEFALFRKTWLSLSGVITDLSGPLSPDAQLLGVGLRQFLAELPARWLANPLSRGFSTHVSNAEILGICATAGLASLRYWTRWMGLSAPSALDRLPDPPHQ